MPRSSKWSLPLRFSNWNAVCISRFCHAYCMPRTSRHPWFDTTSLNSEDIQTVMLETRRSKVTNRLLYYYSSDYENCHMGYFLSYTLRDWSFSSWLGTRLIGHFVPENAMKTLL
jgi:hypothetical protein